MKKLDTWTDVQQFVTNARQALLVPAETREFSRPDQLHIAKQLWRRNISRVNRSKKKKI